MTKKDCKCKDKVKMSVPEGMEFNTGYVMDNTLHSEHYWDTNRNIDVTVSDGQSYIISFDEELDIVVKQMTDLLKEKNKAYGNSALNPTNIFSKLNASESLCARIDDKIARIRNKGINDKTEDTVDDLIGYLLLLKMSLNR
jgi:hypothetical protein